LGGLALKITAGTGKGGGERKRFGPGGESVLPKAKKSGLYPQAQKEFLGTFPQQVDGSGMIKGKKVLKLTGFNLSKACPL